MKNRFDFPIKSSVAKYIDSLVVVVVCDENRIERKTSLMMMRTMCDDEDDDVVCVKLLSRTTDGLSWNVY